MNFGHRTQVALFAGAILLSAVLAVLVLPFHFPPAIAAYSQSYIVGYSNRIAAGLVVLLSVVVLALSLIRPALAPEPLVSTRAAAPPALLLWAAWAACVWVFGALACVALRGDGHSIEDRYFLPQLLKHVIQGRAPYREIEFIYGPLLFYPEALIARGLGGQHAVAEAYYLILLLQHLIGLFMMWLLLRWLPVDRLLCWLLMVCALAYSTSPFLGMNYTLTRFLIAYVCLALVARIQHPWVAAALSFVAVLCVGAVSPELTLVFVIGACVFAVLRWRQSGAWWLLPGAAAITSLALAARMAPPGLIGAVSHFSNGFSHRVVLLSPMLLFCLSAGIWFAPRCVVAASRSRPELVPWPGGMYAMSLVMVPPMLGVAEPLHYFSAGLGAILLTVVYLSGRRWASMLWFVATVCCVGELTFLLWSISVNFYRPAAYAAAGRELQHAWTDHLPAHVRTKIRAGIESHPSPFVIPLDKLESQTHHEPFAIPFELDLRMLEQVARSPAYMPSYFNGTIDVWGPDAQQIKVREIHAVRWLVLPRLSGTAEEPSNLPQMWSWNRIFAAKHVVPVNDLIVKEIDEYFVPRTPLGDGVWLYERKDDDRPLRY